MQLVKNSGWQVLTPTGWSAFDGIKRTLRDTKLTMFSDGTFIETTDEHLVKHSSGEFVRVSELRAGDTLSTGVVVTSVSDAQRDVHVYDLVNVAEGNQYVTNGVVSHNCAFIRDFDTIWTGIYPTLSTGGQAILLSTPNGVGGQFYKLWIEAEAGSNSFNPIKLPWHVHPEHDQVWYNEQLKNLSKKQIAQELECDFLGSGDTFLQPAEMSYLKSLLADHRRSDIDRSLRVWIDPIPGHRYVISADVARGDAADYSACAVIDVETMDVVAEYVGKIPPDRFGDLLAQIGTTYNEGIICPELNSFGWATNTRLRDMGYPRLYYAQAKGDVYNYKSFNPDALPGFTTSPTTRPIMLTRLEEAIRNKRLKPRSQRLFDQLQGFVWHGSKAMALKDCSDDLVMALAIGVWLIDSEICPIQKSSTDVIMLSKGNSVARDQRHGAVFKDVMSIRSTGRYNQQPHGRWNGRYNPDLRWLFR